jgi:succinate dehydrogenase/fumarate reductase flavoprotein subunit
VVRQHTPGLAEKYYEIKAKVVVLATGGFQGSPQMTATYLGHGGDNIFVRSNPGSVGDGLSLASRSGAVTTRGMNTYYGHLLAAPVRAQDVKPKDYLPLAQYRKHENLVTLLIRPLTSSIESKFCLLINEAGKRFADETTGDEIVNQYLAKQEKRRGFLLFK